MKKNKSRHKVKHAAIRLPVPRGLVELVASRGGLESIEATWPLAIVQTCVLHLIRNTFRLASRADWDKMARDLRPVYTAVNEADAARCLDDFHTIWGRLPCTT